MENTILLKSISVIDLAFYNSFGFFIVAMGILVSIRFMGFPDLTIDGSFTIGAAIYALAIKSEFPIFVCLLLAFTLGSGCGAATVFVNKKLGIGKIISSVMIMLLLITVSPYMTGNSSIGLLDASSFFSRLNSFDLRFTRSTFPQAPFSLHPTFSLFLALICFVTTSGLLFIFKTRLGAQMRYLGSAPSPNLLSKSSKETLPYLGLAIGNGLVALGGAVEAERNGGFNQNMGVGIILIGLTIVVLGESIIKTKVRRDYLTINENILGVCLGVVLYSFGLQLLLVLGINFLDVRLTTTLFLLLLLAVASRKHPNTAKLF